MNAPLHFTFRRINKDQTFSFVPPSAPPKTYIIVGAGMTGLFSALELSHYAAPKDKIIVLEARHEAGGRIRTVQNNFSLPLNKCAAWFHSPIGGNILKRFADMFHVKYFTYDSAKYSAFYDTSAHRLKTKLDEDEVSQYENSIYDNVIYNYDDPLFKNLAEQHKDLPASKILDLYQKQKGPLPYLDQWNYKFNYMTEGVYADGISIKSVRDDSEYSFPKYQFHPHTYGTDLYVQDFQKIPLEIAKILEKRNISFFYNHYVKTVNYGHDIEKQNHPVTIECQNGKQFSGDFAIITVSAGVLKKNHISFTPPLPKNYQQSLEKIGMGSFTKIMLEFENVIPHEDMKSIIEFMHIDKEHVQNNMASFYFANLYPDTGKPILYAIANGNYGKKLENNIKNLGYEKGLEIGKKEALTCLQKIFPNITLPKVKHAFITQPGNNKFFEGAWSHLAPGGSKQDRFVLSQPINNRITLAGEHTNAHHYAQDVVASIHEGLEAANEALTLTHNIPKQHFMVENGHVSTEKLPIHINFENQNEHQGHIKIFESSKNKAQYAQLFDIEFHIKAENIRFVMNPQTMKLTLYDGQNNILYTADKNTGYIHYYYDEKTDNYIKSDNIIDGQWVVQPKLIYNDQGDALKLKTTFEIGRDSTQSKRYIKFENIISKPFGCDFITE